MKSDRFNFAVIGGGLTATAMLTQLIAMLKDKSAKRLLDPVRMTIQVFDRGDIFGPGFPHSDKIVLPFHINNMCASEMGIIAGYPRDFQDWVSDNFNYLRKRFAWFREGCSVTEDDKQGCHHYPRAVMGAYLKNRSGDPQDHENGIGQHNHPIQRHLCCGRNDTRPDNRRQHGPQYRSIHIQGCQRHHRSLNPKQLIFPLTIVVSYKDAAKTCRSLRCRSPEKSNHILSCEAVPH